MAEAPKKQVHYFASFEAMSDAMLEHSSRLTMAERLRTLHQLNQVAFASLLPHWPQERTKRLRLYTQRPTETLTEFFARLHQERQLWISSLRSSEPS